MSEDNQKAAEEPKREMLPWEEIADAERIERLRYIIKQEQKQTGKLRQEISELRDLICRHRHGDDHEVLVSASMVNRGGLHGGCCESAGPNHKPWF